MDVSGILKPEELPFSVPQFLADDINDLIEAWETDSDLVPFLLDEVEGSARGVSEENDRWIRSYYVHYGWKKQLCPN